MKRFSPVYLETHKNGELKKKILEAEDNMEWCTLCPQHCKVNRFHSRKGKCNSGFLPIVASSGPHFGEESPLVGRNGSGTIFFSNCNLKCLFCQNCDISQLGYGKEMYRQVGNLQVDSQGIAQRGLIVRHLILPGNLAATYKVIDFIAGLSLNTYLNLMDQYRPEHRAKEFNGLDRPLSRQEYVEYVEYARGEGLAQLD